MVALTIPTNIKISGKQRILDLSEMEKLLRSAHKIAQQECDCRKRMKNCIDPMNGCLELNDYADKAIECGAKEISVEEALEALKATYDAGLVHMAYVFTEDEEPRYICSCCKCCCHSLSAALKFGYSDHLFYSNKISAQDEETCNDCGACIDRCHFEARTMINDKLIYDPEKCSGCGLCLKDCPTGAIKMLDR
jgi:NAD-dependent dihydropyrimidine dehydrogenase PreA subunit